MNDSETRSEKAVKRLHLTLPSLLAEEFESVAAELEMTKVAATREALRDWVDSKIEERMARGYREMAGENTKLMEEFQHVDGEGWE